MKKHPKVCILGGTGFVGRELALRLLACGYQCQLPTRRVHRHRDLRLLPGITLQPITTLDQASLTEAFANCDLVVNLIGILNESARTSFRQVHVELVERVLAAAREAGVPRLLHMSALHACPPGQETTASPSSPPSEYLKSKGAGEALALAAKTPATTAFRPSVIFGRHDSLFNRFAGLIDWTPGFFPLACSGARFAPVWVGDVAEAMVRTIDRPESIGRAYDLCGPRTLSLRELVEYSATLRGRQVRIIELSDKAARRQARLFERLPGKPFTMDNYRSLQIDSVCSDSDGLQELGITPTDIEMEVPGYLAKD
ncbi:complex I NDUFA9 subunit family protein [Thiorhodovibrio frisius]|uniref:Nucleoside-diphosphate-sugar epimerase n=1 Tax=Thiorhodovibrio frisius TaxID=631362 RepID=H8Z575_9GAMM|nr:complex I NDUFA9 subunit family protein [Thiorhodovibrio frisius]EIC20482.1 nucleoside-diphosphate-sugar epimerase [Thiorhodovibrio frisius]WPL21223.1 hopanoid-associated sugar epimerase [Thiorhodovibrio frisius]